MTSAQALLDKATETCGTRYALAKRLSLSQSQLSEIASGKEGLPPGLAAAKRDGSFDAMTRRASPGPHWAERQTTGTSIA